MLILRCLRAQPDGGLRVYRPPRHTSLSTPRAIKIDGDVYTRCQVRRQAARRGVEQSRVTYGAKGRLLI